MFEKYYAIEPLTVMRKPLIFVWLPLLCFGFTAAHAQSVDSSSFKRVAKSIDIADHIGTRDELERFLKENFDTIKQQEPLGALLFYKADLINKTGSLTFCKMHVQQCWVKKIDTLFAFFIAIKTAAGIEKNIASRYGPWKESAEISSDSGPMGGTMFFWRIGQLNIETSTFFTFDPRFEMCDLVTCRTINLEQLIKGEDGKN